MPKKIITKRIGEVLLGRGSINRKQLEEALVYAKAHRERMGQILIRLGFVTEEEVALALTVQYGFPYLPLQNYEIDGDLTEILPERVARQYCLIPIDLIGNALTLAMADPSDVEAIHDVERLTKCVVQTCISTPSEITRAIDRHYKKQDADHPSSDTTPDAPGEASS